jgi:hypothetical protein
MIGSRIKHDFGKCAPIITVFLFLISTCSKNETQYPYHLVPGNWVYNIKQHNDSLYFSTSESGIFQFHPDHPGSVHRVASSGRLPFRSMVFKDTGAMFASSYYSGVYRWEKDTLVPVDWAQVPSWSMKPDASGALWLAGSRGVLFERNDSIVLFNDIRDAHDIAFFGGEVFVVNMRGVSVFDRQSGNLKREYCKGVVCWAVVAYDSVLIAGGLNLCAIITKHACKKISLGSKDNIVWSIEKDAHDTIFLGTQKGLLRIAPGSDRPECIGFFGRCVKSVFIDKSGRLWVGRYYK